VQPWEPVLRLCAFFLTGLCDTLVQYVACWTIVLLVLWINDVGEYNSIPITLLRTTLHFFFTQVRCHFVMLKVQGCY
jgi:hypothetical protein